ncbi:MAG: DNA helicase RecQ [Pseudomonadota bacterium]
MSSDTASSDTVGSDAVGSDAVGGETTISPAPLAPAATRDALDATLSAVFGFDRFRDGQREIVEAMVAGRDVMAIMPTGGGKSLCYQLPALTGEGLTVVISPLIALMEDQVSALRATGVEAGMLTSATTEDERARVVDALRAGRLRLLYIAPERLASEAFCGWLARLNVDRLAVDEAHCIAQWGHDFRPDYLRLGPLAARLGVPVAAFTATADSDTRREIVDRLFDRRAPEIFLRGFDRPNLFLAFEAKEGGDRQIVDWVVARGLVSGIVYAATRARCERLAAALGRAGIKAAAYHAGLEAAEREARQRAFSRADDMVICATVAFGMGVDKPDVRFVAQADLPKSIEAYYQEIGRAGRDGAPAETRTFYGPDDIRLARARIDESGAPEDRRQADHARLSALLSLADSPGCRRVGLLAYFGETVEPCGACDNCQDPPRVIDGTEPAQMALSAMLRTGERFGAGHIIAVLRGQANERTERLGHDRLKTWGVGGAWAEAAWKSWLNQMQAQGLCAIDIDRHRAWTVTEDGWSVLRGERMVTLRPAEAARPRGRSKSAVSAGGARPLAAVAPEDAALFEALRTERRRLADEAGVPAYVVFPDRTLMALAAEKPRDLQAMAGVHGIGQAKLQRFGEDFLSVIRANT